MPLSSDKKVYILVSILVLVLVTVPYLYAGVQSGPDYQFEGFLLNPIDGNSYLAKMYQGWEGRWRFTLPYTREPGDGAYLFLFYILLGHIARVLNLPLLMVFHGFRILGTGLLLTSLARFFHLTFSSSRNKRLAFSLAALGSGLGWLAIPWGLFTADFWVAEMYPFLSAYANPHFPLGLATMMVLIKPGKKTPSWVWGVLTGLLAMFLPFGVVIVILLQTVSLIVEYLSLENGSFIEMVKRREFKILMWIGGCGLPLLIYEMWVTSTDPVLAVWHAQNLTPSPPIWNTVLSLSPPLLFALLGIKRTWNKPSARHLVYWMILGAALAYFPWSLQRRFLLGYYIPLSGMAIFGLEKIMDRFGIHYRTLVIILVIFVLPTNLIVLTSAIQAVRNHDPRIYMTGEEVDALAWIRENTGKEDVILAAPETGLLIPAYTGRRVIYGHPFETTKAEAKEELVKDFYQGQWANDQIRVFLEKNEIDYIFYGPREGELGAFPASDWVKITYRDQGLRIFKVIP